MQWCTGIAFSFHWVKGHTYLIYRPLTRDERLNIEADLKADVIRAQASGIMVAGPNCAHWDIEEALMSIIGSKVTSDMKTQLTSQMHADDLRAFLMMKETWSPQTLDYIDWYASEVALGRLSNNHQMTIVKL
jgi:hypothetical protein